MTERVRDHPRRRGRARRAVVRCGLLVSMTMALLGSRAEAADPPPFDIEVDQTSAVFSLTNLAPGPLGSRCLVLSVRSGTTDRAYLSATVGGTGLADYLDLTVDVGTSADPASCTDFAGATVFTGTVGELGTAHAAPVDGVVLPIADGASAVIRFGLSLRSDNAAQGRTATLVFRFDAQDTGPPAPTTTVAATTVPATVAPDTTLPSTLAPDTTAPTSAPGAPSTVAATTTTSVGATTTSTGATTTAGAPEGVGRRGSSATGSGTGGGTARTTAPTTAPAAAGGPAELEVRDPTRAPETRSVAAQAVEVVTETVAVAAKTSSVPAVFVSFVFAFLIVQDRFDRNDPKLANAPLAPEPELAFLPRGRRVTP